MIEIEANRQRYRDIVKGKVRENLYRYINQIDITGKQGNDLVKIPLPRIEIPRFQYGLRDRGGTGQGDGEPGDVLGRDGQEQGNEQAGNQHAEHQYEITIDEFVEIISDELGLPDLKPKDSAQINNPEYHIKGIRRTGPRGLIVKKRSLLEGLKRGLAAGSYIPGVIVPEKSDFRYRDFKLVENPNLNAVVIFMRDVSGSMNEQKKKIARTLASYSHAYLRKQYKGLEECFIAYDGKPWEIDNAEDFFNITSRGGTHISNAYKFVNETIDDRFPSKNWNVYVMHLTDGESLSRDDDNRSINFIKGILPKVNALFYAQIMQDKGFYGRLKDEFPLRSDDCPIRAYILNNNGQILPAMKTFFAPGR